VARDILLADHRIDEQHLRHGSASPQPAVVGSRRRPRMLRAQELHQRLEAYVVAEEYSALGAIVRHAIGVPGQLQKYLAKPVIGRIGIEPRLQIWVEDADE